MFVGVISLLFLYIIAWGCGLMRKQKANVYETFMLSNVVFIMCEQCVVLCCFVLQMFKDVPSHRLETLLPNASVSMSKWDQYVLLGSVSAGLVTVAVRALSYLADLHLRWLWAVLVVVSLGGLRSFTAYKNKRNAYLLKLTAMLYYKNVANNRGALTLLADRAADEQFKESLLAYSFLLSSAHAETLLLTREDVRAAVEKWLLAQLNANVQFDVDGAVTSLMQLGLLHEGADKRLSVLPLKEAVRSLQAHAAAQVMSETAFETTDGEEEDGFDMAGNSQS